MEASASSRGSLGSRSLLEMIEISSGPVKNERATGRRVRSDNSQSKSLTQVVSLWQYSDLALIVVAVKFQSPLPRLRTLRVCTRTSDVMVNKHAQTALSVFVSLTGALHRSRSMRV
jgi:hypothetical protein